MATTLATPTPVTASSPARRLLGYFLLGTWFGVVLTKSQVVSWFRIQEMFRFQSFYMYGVLGSAVLVAGISIALLRRFRVKTLDGAEIVIPPKGMGRGDRYWGGGTVFGIGWGVPGGLPRPPFPLVRPGGGVGIVPLLSP